MPDMQYHDAIYSDQRWRMHQVVVSELMCGTLTLKAGDESWPSSLYDQICETAHKTYKEGMTREQWQAATLRELCANSTEARKPAETDSWDMNAPCPRRG